MTEVEHYRARCNYYRALLTSMIIRLDDDEHLMRDLIQQARMLDRAPEYNSREWQEIHGIPFE